MTARNLLVLLAMLAIPFAVYLATPSPGPVDKAAAVEARFEELVAAKFSDVPEVTADDLVDDAGDLVFVDVRAPEERAVSTIPGAIPAASVEADLDAYRGKKLVTYCTIGYRSALFARDLRHSGLDAVNLRGGVLAWSHAGGGFEHEGHPTKRLHVWGGDWDLAADGYETTW